ncbi:class I SAM-dependent methyltransferase [Gordonia soli]|uniref:Putative methyltransferase n=1 Tax=Gordonia soli NBRC 108243 TaxID=1223545 RepID=M0QKS3_9ACTN|nr:class I SAM-dependent methyltransferase [Gordonia soli]GAC69163.1 putative methyltransferase [Gordonia soli NBRC 108243]
MTSGRPTTQEAVDWLARWDLQQGHYMPDREERFDTLIDIVEEVVDRTDPLVVDLGTGPGSLAHRVIDRIPGARVVGVDADPLLLDLGTIARPDHRIRTVLTDIREPGWFSRLDLNRAPDVYVSSTALHWINAEPLRQVLAECGRTVAPGGLFVDADHLYEGDRAPRLDGVLRALTDRRARRRGTRQDEDWQRWWEAVEEAPELADLVAARAGGFDHVVTEKPTVYDYLTFLRDGGFAEAGTAWQVGDDRIIVAIK